MTKSKPKILIIDNDPLILAYLRSFLEKNYDVMTSTSLENIYVLIANDKFSLILIDENLKIDNDGLQFARELKQIPRFNNTPIIIMSSCCEENMSKKAEENSIDKFISKKYDQRYFTDTIIEVMSRLSCL